MGCKGLDLPLGERYGRLLTRKKVKIKRGKEYINGWICDCDCGGTAKVRQSDLRTGNTQSCGCLVRELRIKRFSENNPSTKGSQVSNLKGHIYERLRVTGLNSIRVSGNGSRRAYWDTICKCGNTFVVAGQSLVAGKAKSCGCLRDELVAIRRQERRQKGIQHQTKRRAQ